MYVLQKDYTQDYSSKPESIYAIVIYYIIYYLCTCFSFVYAVYDI